MEVVKELNNKVKQSCIELISKRIISYDTYCKKLRSIISDIEIKGVTKKEANAEWNAFTAYRYSLYTKNLEYLIQTSEIAINKSCGRSDRRNIVRVVLKYATLCNSKAYDASFKLSSTKFSEELYKD